MKKQPGVFVGTTNHISLGADNSEFEYVYHHKLRPFIVALNNYPDIKAALHYSGVLLHWIEKAHPEFFMLVGDLLDRRQVELIGGGFYEPMLPLIPHHDRIGQIEMLTTYIRKQFGKRPLGCWLPAAAWDQSLVGALNACGMAYTFLREEQFVQAGLSGEDLYAPCITEDQGKLLTVIPVLKSLTLEGCRDSISRLLERKAEGIPPDRERLIVLCPDSFFGREGGLYSGEEGLNRFFGELSSCAHLVDFTTPGKVCKSRAQRGKVYFAPSSDVNVAAPGEKSRMLPPKHFLIRYPEANGIYAKMMHTHILINQLRGDKARKQSAQEELWKGQGYDSFCRIEGGGIFRNSVRNAAYRALVEAERITRRKGAFVPSLMTFDFDLDGEVEYLFQVEHINCYVKTRGASIFEFDFLPRSWNYLDTFGAGSVSGGAPNRRRASFEDILAPQDVPPEEFALTGFTEGRPGIRYCGGEFWETGETDKVKKKAAFLLSPRASGPWSSIAIRKEYHLKRESLAIRYAITNRGAAPESFNFIPRIDLAFPGEGAECQRAYRIGPAVPNAERARDPLALGPDGPVSVEGAAAIEFQDLRNEVILTLGSDRGFRAAILPIRCDCPVYGRETSLYQSTCVLPAHPVSLAPDASWSVEFTLRLSY